MLKSQQFLSICLAVTLLSFDYSAFAGGFFADTREEVRKKINSIINEGGAWGAIPPLKCGAPLIIRNCSVELRSGVTFHMSDVAPITEDEKFDETKKAIVTKKYQEHIESTDSNLYKMQVFVDIFDVRNDSKFEIDTICGSIFAYANKNEDLHEGIEIYGEYLRRASNKQDATGKPASSGRRLENGGSLGVSVHREMIICFLSAETTEDYFSDE